MLCDFLFKVPSTLHAVMKPVTMGWQADTQALEGCMSLIKAAVAAGPYSSLQQIDMRVGMRKYLGVFERRGKKMSEIAPTVNSLLRAACALESDAIDAVPQLFIVLFNCLFHLIHFVLKSILPCPPPLPPLSFFSFLSG